MAYVFEPLADDSEIAPLLPLWNELARDVSPFASAAFFTAWRSSFGADKTGFLIVGRDGTTPCFLLPLWYRNDDPNRWSSFGEFRADYTEALMSAGDPQLGRAFWRWLETAAPCQFAKISRFPIDSNLGRTAPFTTLTRRGRALHALRASTLRNGVRYLTTGIQSEHPYADRAQIEALALRLDARYMKRNVKMVAKFGGEVTYSVLRGAAAIEPLLSRFYDLHVANFAATGRASQFENADDRRFYELLVASPSLNDVVQMDVLRAGDRPVAMHLGFQDKNCIYYYKPTFDIELAKASPGKLLLAYLFARAREEDVQRIDLLKGTEPYKTEWANHTRPTATCTLVRRRVADLVRSVTTRWAGH